MLSHQVLMIPIKGVKIGFHCKLNGFDDVTQKVVVKNSARRG